MKLVFSFIILFFLTITIANAQSVSNIRFEHSGKQVVIYYDLSGELGSAWRIGIYCSQDGGTTWSSPIRELTFEFGNTIKPGTNKKVTWDVLVEREKLEGEISFKVEATKREELVTDIDGNFYHIVTIGTQVWMASNLKTTKFKNGINIPLVTGNSGWDNLSTPGYCWYNNDEAANNSTYGAVYNWYTVKTGKLCPTGWHVPNYAEWTTLTTFLGGEDVAGGKLKEISTAHWLSPNIGATNEFGFAAVPGGARDFDGKFGDIGECGYWWSSSENRRRSAWNRSMAGHYSNVYRSVYSKTNGFSVRCLQD